VSVFTTWTIVVVLLASCGDDEAPPVDVDAGAEPVCEPPPDPYDAPLDPGPGLEGVDPTVPSGCTGTWIVGVRGRVEDTDRQGLGAVRTQVCATPAGSDLLLCLVPPTTDAAGDFAIVVDDLRARCVDRMTMRALLPGSAHATTYCELALTPTDSVLDLPDPLVMFETRRPECLPPRGDPAAPRTVTLADGVELLDLRPEQIDDYEALAGGRHDITGSCILSRAPPGGFAGTYGFRPETDVDGGIAVRIPNDAGLAPGASVDLYELGGLATTLADGTSVEEGEWARIGTATVSADGATIESDPGTRLTVLTWLGWTAP
jgi:hypothetical protein